MKRIFRLIDPVWEKLRFWRKKKEEKAVASLTSLGYTVILEKDGFQKQFIHPKDKKHRAIQYFTSPLE